MKQPDPQQGRSLSLELSPAEHAAILLAADEIPYQIHHAATIFEFLGVGHSLGTFDSKPDVIISICKFAGRALRSIADTEGNHLSDLAYKLRKSKEVNHDEA